jgi:hypothetical protein
LVAGGMVGDKAHRATSTFRADRAILCQSKPEPSNPA